MFKIGITSTRNGMTEEQADLCFRLLRAFSEKPLLQGEQPRFFHGDCIGGDLDAHEMARFLGYHITVLPQSRHPKLRAYCEADEIREPKEDPLERNRDMVDEIDILLAAPPYPWRVRSGSWSTYNYALNQHKRAWLL